MRPLIRKLLAVLLSLLLGLLPLQGAMASAFSVTYADEQLEAELVESPGDAIAMAAGDCGHDCERCTIDGCNNGASCASMQCASCMATTLSSSSAVTVQTAAEKMSSFKHGVQSIAVAPLYRPPRA